MRLRRYFWQEVKILRSFVFRAQSDFQFMNLKSIILDNRCFKRIVMMILEIYLMLKIVYQFQKKMEVYK